MENLNNSGSSEIPGSKTHADPGTKQLKFSKKYDRERAERYFEKHQKGFGRKLSNWRETGILRKAMKIAGNPNSVLDIPAGAGRFWNLLAENPGRKIFISDNSLDMLGTGLRFRERELTEKLLPFQSSAFTIPLKNNSVENVFCVRLLHHIGESADRVSMMREMARVTSGTICLTLWIDGNYKAFKRRKAEARRKKKLYQNRFVVPRKQFEQEVQEAGLAIVERVDYLRFHSMWAAYVLKK